MGTMLLMFPTGTKGEESQQDTHATIVNKQEETTTSTSNSIVKESSSPERKQVKDQISDSATNSPIVADLTPFVEKNVKILVDNGSSLQIGQNQTDSAYLGSEESLSNQLHVIHSLGNGWVTIENKATGKFLTVENQAVVYTNFSGLDHQKWQFVNEQNEHYAIQSKSGAYLVRSESNEIGLSTNRSDQRWKLETSVTNETTSTNQTKTTETTAKSNQSITNYQQKSVPMNVITQTILSNSKVKITIANPNGGNAQMVQFPTWSKTNGQDDIRWLKGTKNGDGSWSVTVDSANFKNSGDFYTHVYVTDNGKNQFLGATSYSLSMDEVKNRLAHLPFYYSQLDWRWKTKNYGMANLGAAGCVPTSMAMILKGQFGLNVTPIDTANRLYSYGGYNQQYFGASGIDFVRGMNSYGRTIMMIRSLNELNDYLSKGYAVVMFVDVGIGHAIVAHTYANGKTLVYDPYGKQFYSGYASTNSLWNSPSKDRIDWTAGRPYFAVK